MATLQERSGSYRVLFVYHGKRHTFTIGRVAQGEAEAKAAQVDYLLLRLKQRLLTLPPGMDIVTFMEFDGKAPSELPERDSLTLVGLRDQYLKTHRNGSLEQTTLDGIELHFKHLVSSLGGLFPAQELSLAQLQEHADRRAKMKWHGDKLSPATIRKELITLRTAWNWGVGMGLVSGRFPALRKVRLRKPDEKPPFMTWEEIERRITAGGLSEKQIAELWDALYLTLADIKEILEHVRKHALQPWVYPMACLAGHTGARRSEMLRVLEADVDLAGGTILIREKKRRHDRSTTRRVPLSPFLATALKQWIAERPRGQHLFAQNATVMRSKTKRVAATPITPDEAGDHFKRALAGSKWEVIRGWHIFRHSFISLAASRGIDQRLIDEWVGHQTEEQRRRYRHLLPSTQQQAIRLVFADGK